MFDDVVSDGALARIWNYARNDTYAFDFSRTVPTAFEGQQLRGTLVSSMLPSSSLPVRQAVYPTGDGIDEILATIYSTREELSSWWGRHGVEWDIVTACANLYPEESARSWHVDDPPARGSYTFYVHPDWSVGWGGELCIADDVAHDAVRDQTGDDQARAEAASRAMMTTGISTSILPKPGRLVIMAPDTIHKVNRVYPTAGGRMRAAIIGFALARARPQSEGAISE